MPARPARTAPAEALAARPQPDALAGLWYLVAHTAEAGPRDSFAVTCEFRPHPEGGFDLIETGRRGSLGGEAEVTRLRVRCPAAGRMALARRGSLAGALPFLRTEQHYALGDDGLCVIWDPLRATARLLSRAPHPAGNPLPEAEAFLATQGLGAPLERAVQP